MENKITNIEPKGHTTVKVEDTDGNKLILFPREDFYTAILNCSNGKDYMFDSNFYNQDDYKHQPHLSGFSSTLFDSILNKTSKLGVSISPGEYLELGKLESPFRTICRDSLDHLFERPPQR